MAKAKKTLVKKSRAASGDAAEVLRRLKQKRDQSPDGCIFC